MSDSETENLATVCKTFTTQETLHPTLEQKIFIFYHIFCSPDSTKIVIMQQQIDRIIFSGLYDVVDTIYCFLVGDNVAAIQQNAQVLEHTGTKFTVVYPSLGANYEKYTLQKIRQYISHADVFLYIHTKGISHALHSQIYKNIHDWRTLLEYHLIRSFRVCIKKILRENFDTVGVNFSESPAPHYSGNMWWCSGRYFLSLPVEIGDDYFAPEFYVLSPRAAAKPPTSEMAASPPVRHCNMFSSGINHYISNYPTEKYINGSREPNNISDAK